MRNGSAVGDRKRLSGATFYNALCLVWIQAHAMHLDPPVPLVSLLHVIAAHIWSEGTTNSLRLHLLQSIDELCGDFGNDPYSYQ